MKDYLGNEIVAGMTVIIIRTKPIIGDIYEHKKKRNGKGFFKPKLVVKQPKECWECVGEYPVHANEKGELRYTVKTDWCTLEYPLDFPYMVSQPSIDIVAIKGISDMNPKPN